MSRSHRRRRAAGIAALLLSAGAAQAEVKSASAAGFAIENAETVPATPAQAWRALVEDVDRWWPKDHTWWGKASTLSIAPRAGGCFCETDGARQAQHMTVVFVEPNKLLRMTGGLGPLQGMGLHGALEWRFEPVEQGTRIVLRYQAGGYSTEDLAKFAPVVDKVQGTQLGGLAAHLRARTATPPKR